MYRRYNFDCILDNSSWLIRLFYQNFVFDVHVATA
jgi:hypothetical protein